MKPPHLPDDLDLDDQVAIVLGKGRRQRAVPFGRKAALALDRSLRLRASQPFTHLPTLWSGRAGAMTPSGLFQVIADRGASVGLPGLHPHQFRHGFADAWLSAAPPPKSRVRRPDERRRRQFLEQRRAVHVRFLAALKEWEPLRARDWRLRSAADEPSLTPAQRDDAMRRWQEARNLTEPYFQRLLWASGAGRRLVGCRWTPATTTPRGSDATPPRQGAAVPGMVEPLTPREVEVLGLLAEGRSNQRIAEELVVSLDTVEKHVSHVLDKLAAANAPRPSPARGSSACSADASRRPHRPTGLPSHWHDPADRPAFATGTTGRPPCLRGGCGGT